MKRSREPDEDLVQDDSDDGAESTEPQQNVSSDSQRAAKIVGLDSAIDDSEAAAIVMRCSLPPHKEPLAFRTYPEYEAHYHSFHLNRCIECRKNFPSNHLLGVHIEECHDPLVRVKREQGERTFSCFVEGCDRKCSTHQKRRMHLIDKHMYPKNYFFGVTKDGIDGRRSLINDGGHRRRRSSAASQTGAKTRPNETQSAASKNPLKPQDLPEEEPTEKMSIDPEVEDITGAMSALNFVPPSVRFGRGRAGFAKS